MALEQEVVAGLSDYKQKLLEISASTTDVVDPEEIRRQLASEGVPSSSSIVVIPYSIPNLRQAESVAEQAQWHEPFTAGRFRDATAKRLRLDGGESIYEVGFPTVFYSSLLDLAVVIDDSTTNSELFGEIYAKGAFVDSFIHELAHSAFAHINSLRIKCAPETAVKVKETYNIGQVSEEVILWPGGGTENEYSPTWIDEAFSVYMSSMVRARIHPEGIPKASYIMEHEEFGVEEIEVPPPYLIFSEDYPDEPGDIGGSTAGIGLEALEAKRPGLIDRIKALAAGKLAVQVFHNDLKNSVGNQLYTAITTRQPYSTWGNVLSQIEEL